MMIRKDSTAASSDKVKVPLSAGNVFFSIEIRMALASVCLFVCACVSNRCLWPGPGDSVGALSALMRQQKRPGWRAAHCLWAA